MNDFKICRKGKHQYAKHESQCPECEKAKRAISEAIPKSEKTHYPRGLHPNTIPNHFRKGQVLNPLGYHSRDPNIVAAKKLTNKQLAEVAALIVNNSYEDLQRLAEDPNASVLQRMTMALARRVIEKGDPQAWEALLNRIVGKVTDKLDVTANSQPQVLITLPDNQREVKEIVESLPEIPQAIPSGDGDSSDE